MDHISQSRPDALRNNISTPRNPLPGRIGAFVTFAAVPASRFASAYADFLNGAGQRSWLKTATDHERGLGSLLSDVGYTLEADRSCGALGGWRHRSFPFFHQQRDRPSGEVFAESV